MDNHLPFRTTPRIAPPASNAPQPATFASNPFGLDELYESLLHSSTSANELIEQAVSHPDERVVITLIKHASNVRPQIRWKLYLRGLEICKSEDIVWHPLFDALASHHYWPKEHKVIPAQRRLYRSAQEQIDDLIPWIEQQTDPSQIKPLLEFETEAVHLVVARYAGVMTEELIRDLPAYALATNPNVHDDLAREIAEYAILRFTGAEKEDFQNPWARELASSISVHDAYQTITGFARAGRQIPETCIDRLIEHLERSRYAMYLIEKFGAQLTEAQLEKILNKTADTDTLYFLLTHPEATRSLKRKIIDKATTTQKYQLRQRLSADLQALTNPDVREFVLETTSWEILERALTTAAKADSEAFLPILQRCIEAIPHTIVHVVGQPTLDPSIEWAKLIRGKYLDELIEGLILAKEHGAIEQLAFYPPAAANSKLQRALIADPDATSPALFAILPHLRESQFLHLFRKLVNRSPHHPARVAKILAEHKPETLAILEPEDLEILLRAEDRQARLLAITLITEMKNKPATKSRRNTSASRTKTSDKTSKKSIRNPSRSPKRDAHKTSVGKRAARKNIQDRSDDDKQIRRKQS